MLYLISQVNLFRVPSITFRDPFEVATHSLRTPALVYKRRF